jgi:uncharacterized oxidoreductase
MGLRMSGNTVLITGGATGIGLSLAEELISAGNEVIVCGRREEKLKEARLRLPGLHTKRCDLSVESERRGLFEWVSNAFPRINVLVNNAGIQRVIDLRKGTVDLSSGDDEIEVNFKAYVHLAALFTPQFLIRKESAIVNVSSALGFVPIAIMPIYCATKAAIHSYSMSLRHQLRGTPVKVYEVIPPTVDTDLDRGARARRGQTEVGIQPPEVAKATMAGLEADNYEIVIGEARNLREASSEGVRRIFEGMNRW